MGVKGGFDTYKRRGEWVELIFMTRAAELGFTVVFRRVQVKSTDVPRGDGGYVCYLKRTGIRYYIVEDVDFFAIYVLEKKAWFISPARVVLRLKSNIRVAPGMKGQKYARYEEVWGLLRRKRRK
jgi:hypothetical protein